MKGHGIKSISDMYMDSKARCIPNEYLEDDFDNGTHISLCFGIFEKDEKGKIVYCSDHECNERSERQLTDSKPHSHMIGHIGIDIVFEKFLGIEKEDPPYVNVGYSMKHHFQGKGIMNEVIGYMIPIFKKTLNMNTLYAFVYFKGASSHLLLKNGFAEPCNGQDSMMGGEKIICYVHEDTLSTPAVINDSDTDGSNLSKRFKHLRDFIAL